MTLRQGLKWSLGLHGILLVTWIARSLFVASTAQLSAPLLRVDLVALPDFTRQELQQMRDLPRASRAAREETSEEAPGPMGKLKSRKDRLGKALARFRALREVNEALDSPETPRLSVIKGNILSPGKSLSERARETGASAYVDAVQDQLESKFAVPVWLSRMEPRARVVLTLDATGRVLSTRFVEASGHPQYDQIVLRTIHMAEPFPPPPKELWQSLRTGGIEVQFPIR